VVWGYDNTLPLVEKTFLYEGLIIPNRMIKDRVAYKITNVNPMYYIHGFMIKTARGDGQKHDYVESINLFGHHPNRKSDTGVYCMPDYKKGVPYDMSYFQRLITNIKTHYLDDCFHTPNKMYMDYERMKSIAMQINQGE